MFKDEGQEGDDESPEDSGGWHHPGYDRKKNGRGAYLCMERECLKKARKNKGLERSLKMSIPDEIYDNLEKEFEKGE